MPRIIFAISFVLLPFPVRAGIVTSNLGQPYSSSQAVGVGGGTITTIAMSFTVNNSDYLLDSVSLSMSSGFGGGSFAVEIFDNDKSKDSPGSLFATLVGNSNPTVEGVYSYVSLGTTLNANSKYWIVASAPTSNANGFPWKYTESSAEDAGSIWSITDSAMRRQFAKNPVDSGWYTVPDMHQFSVAATAVPEPSTFVLGGTFALLLTLAASLRLRRESSSLKDCP